MAQYGSEAYDLSLFEKKKAKITPLHAQKAGKEQKRRTRLQNILNGIVTSVVAAVVLTVVTLMITSQIRLTEMNIAINEQEKIYNEAVSETKRLESELAAQTSAQSVEEYAESVGLRQMESGQIQYITVETPEDQAAPEPEQSLWEFLVGAVKAWLY